MTLQGHGLDTHQEQLERLRAENEALRAELMRAQQLANMGTMAAMVAHEINNVLTPLVSYAQLAQSDPSFAAKALARAADGGHRAAAICQSLLGLTAEADCPKELVRLAALVRDTFEAMARDPQKDLIELTVDIDESLDLSTRRVEFQHVLLNLLLNARAAVLKNTAARAIRVAARRLRDGQPGVEIQVADNGPGIDPEMTARIFEPFFTTRGRCACQQTGPAAAPSRGRKSGKPKAHSPAATNASGQWKSDAPADPNGSQAPCSPRGYGLGLAFCHRVVTNLGGTITLDSQPGQGTTFTIMLPQGRQ